ncbi:glutamate decarboxylase 2 [Aspergillus brasiliensis]|nr:glutamate decarboxylase 2 [Aspergillus brasiliensis]
MSKKEQESFNDDLTSGSDGVTRGDELVEILHPIIQSLVQFFNQRNQTSCPPELLSLLQDPSQLHPLLSPSLPQTGQGVEDLARTCSTLLQHTINTASPTFLDKLWSASSPPGIGADLLLSAINGNAHVLRVSPALTTIEKHLSKQLACLFGLNGPYSGGVTMPGGAGANLTALLTARNARFPSIRSSGLTTKTPSNMTQLKIFTSEAAHYSIANAAQIIGLGSTTGVHRIPTTRMGQMDLDALEAALAAAATTKVIPLCIIATAGTTVRGAYDPLKQIGQLARRYNAWFHIDACWGGAAVFSESLREKYLAGCELADSISFNPHKMLGVPQICSFLLAADLRWLWGANRQEEAAYLFHGGDNTSDTSSNTSSSLMLSGRPAVKEGGKEEEEKKGWRHESSPLLRNAPDPSEIYDLAAFTPQCGRRPDALKLYFHWRYYGTEGIAKHVEVAFQSARYLGRLVKGTGKFRLVGSILDDGGDDGISCAQVCFYYRHPSSSSSSSSSAAAALRESIEDHTTRNTHFTRRLSAGLLARGWMVDYAPGTGRFGDHGEFLRVVCNRSTTREVVEKLVKVLMEVVRGMEEEERRGVRSRL